MFLIPPTSRMVPHYHQSKKSVNTNLVIVQTVYVSALLLYTLHTIDNLNAMRGSDSMSFFQDS